MDKMERGIISGNFLQFLPLSQMERGEMTPKFEGLFPSPF